MTASAAHFSAHDGTRLAYHVHGEGRPLVCLPGGPMRDAAYFGSLGGLAAAAGRRLVFLDLRGTGASARPEDPSTYRCDRQAHDIEALREHLGLERLDLLAHSAGANLAARYAERHPKRIGRLVLVTPNGAAVGIDAGAEERRQIALLREDEPWFADAWAGLQAVATGQAAFEDWQRITPFKYGRWDDAARAHEAAGEHQRHEEAAGVFMSDNSFAPEATRHALAALPGPVLLLAGEFDVASPPAAVERLADLLPDARVVVQPGAGHFPWLDDPAPFASTVAAFLS
ncbi:alpha/beta fold hydrolase [Streptomyces sp. WMMC1477]|uniref:alpha/beta fold hydrolase n=1 Tax=Streptomyces sp. WMMC1477 TaxID=3015155 RepID=UPI0022B6DB48|nr:alpha/beta hydrolase [Streptomyces sp. WMMC1477]MCZ7433415.1 alpha/beta hydrolase [Streptomyces sp. WMMC1477]